MYATTSCESLSRRESLVSHVQSKFQHDDFLTKPLRKESFRFHWNFVMNMN